MSTTTAVTWRENAAGALALYAVAFVLLLAATTNYLAGQADAATPRYAADAHVTRAGCIDHDTSRYRLHLDNRASSEPVTFDTGIKRPHRAWRYRYVTVPAGEKVTRRVPVDVGRSVRIVAGSFDAPLVDTTRYGRACR